MELKTHLSKDELLAAKNPVSRERFRKHARPIRIKIGRTLVKQAKPGESKRTKSLGWKTNDKAFINIGGKQVWVQINFSMTVIGSKAAPESIPGDTDAPDQEHI